MIIRLLLLFSTFFYLCTPAQAQVISYARSVVDTLTSAEMAGRGYVADGHLKAATYIAGEFQQMGLHSFGNGYFQEFPIEINTLPGALSLQVDNKLLQPGIDYLISPCSQSMEGTFPVVKLKAETLLNPEALLQQLQQVEGKVLVFDQTQLTPLSTEARQQVNESLAFLKNFKNNPAAATLLLTDQKLTWHTAGTPCQTPQFTIRKEALPEIPKEVTLKVEGRLEPRLNTQNVIGYLEGKKPEKGYLLISAHYDHLGAMGNATFFPGANDNASGVAMLLSLAKHFSKKENRPDYNLLFVAFGAEEAGLLGSQYFIANPPLPLRKINFLINLDILGTGDDGIKVVNASVFEKEFTQLKELNQKLPDSLPQIAPRGEACNSDHCFFYQAGIPCFYIYTLGGIQAYHDVYDKAETLPLTAFQPLHQLLVNFIKTFGSAA